MIGTLQISPYSVANIFLVTFTFLLFVYVCVLPQYSICIVGEGRPNVFVQEVFHDA